MVLVLLIRWKYQRSPPAAVVAEWLRRWTRNPMGFSLTGSNPVRDDTPFEYQGQGQHGWTKVLLN